MNHLQIKGYNLMKEKNNLTENIASINQYQGIIYDKDRKYRHI